MGSGKSSASIWTVFNTHATADTRQPRHSLSVAWTRIKDDNTDFATVGSSLVGGVDIVQGQLGTITEPDTFKYYDETERVINLMYDRVVEEPLGGMSYAIGDVVFDNTTGRFSWGVSDTIGTALKPRRPLKMFMGFQLQSQEKLVPVMYGTTDKVFNDRGGSFANVQAVDYVAYINDYELESAMYVDQRTDQIIADILDTVGFGSDQYSLDEGLNTIGFAWFEKGTKAGEAVRKLCESEEGHFFQDEEGLLRFENRRNILNKTVHTWTINPEDVIEYENDGSTQIINRVTVEAEPRAEDASGEIWELGTVELIEPGQTIEIWATFDNPVTEIITPEAITDYDANTQPDETGSYIEDQIDVVIEKFATSAKLTLTNNYVGDAYIILFRLRGTPATITNPIKEIYNDSDSEETYGRQQMTIKNDFIDTESFAYYLARAIVRKYSNPINKLSVTILGMPCIQIKDRVRVKDPDTGEYIEYRVMRVQGRMSQTSFTTTLKLREITDAESDCPAIVGTATVDGSCVVWI